MRTARVRVSTVIEAPPRVVWASVCDIASHVDWMEDAVAIRFTSRHHDGVGATFDCDTKIGPLRLTDVMQITEWSKERAIGVRHVGLVTGEGRFTLRRARGGRTRFTWDERLVFPWWLGGPIGGVLGGQVLARIWRRNLGNLKRIIEQPPAEGQRTVTDGSPTAMRPRARLRSRRRRTRSQR